MSRRPRLTRNFDHTVRDQRPRGRSIPGVGFNIQGGNTDLNGNTNTDRMSYITQSGFKSSVNGPCRANGSQVRILGYRAASEMNTTVANGTIATADCGVTKAEATTWDASHPSDKWQLTVGGTVPTSWYGFPGFTGGNIGSATFQARWASNVISFIQANGYDGVFIDNTLASYPYDGTSSTIDQYPSQALWEAAMLSWVAGISAPIKAAGYYVLPNTHKFISLNGSSNDGVFDKQWFTDVAGAGASGCMNENFMVSPTDVTHLRSTAAGFQDFFNEWLGLIDSCQNAGADFHGLMHQSTGTSATRMYGRVAFMLKWNGRGGSFMYNANGDNWATDWTTDIGQPVADMTTVGVGRQRLYEHGAVVLNPDPSSSQLFTLVGNHIRATTGAIVSSLTLTPKTSEILTRV